MNNLIQKLAISATTSALSLVVLSSVPAQALSMYSFTQTLASDGVLSGDFSGTDTNNNLKIDSNEFTSFTSRFQSAIPGFSDVTWGVENLASESYFESPDDYSFTLTAPAPFPDGTGWNSNSLGQATYVGYASVPDGPISSVDSQTEPLRFSAVPEPSSIGGAVLFGIGCLILKRKLKR